MHRSWGSCLGPRDLFLVPATVWEYFGPAMMSMSSSLLYSQFVEYTHDQQMFLKLQAMATSNCYKSYERTRLVERAAAA